MLRSNKGPQILGVNKICWKSDKNKGLPTVIRPLHPYQVLVQPPHWYPRSSAWVPATRILLAFLSNGRKSLLKSFPFFNRTRDFRTASRARSLCGYKKSMMVSKVKILIRLWYLQTINQGTWKIKISYIQQQFNLVLLGGVRYKVKMTP